MGPLCLTGTKPSSKPIIHTTLQNNVLNPSNSQLQDSYVSCTCLWKNFIIFKVLTWYYDCLIKLHKTAIFYKLALSFSSNFHLPVLLSDRIQGFFKITYFTETCNRSTQDTTTNFPQNLEMRLLVECFPITLKLWRHARYWNWPYFEMRWSFTH